MRRSLFLTRALLLAALLASTFACVKLPRRAALPGDNEPPAPAAATDAPQTRISINRATREELERLPGVGRALAARIVEHRERHGLFRRPEHLIIVRGFSERRFRELRALITVD
ncbi:MAG TPA: helix-hairpin-helix domain-containing protein [Pyrinomonadaceae bacterium]|nr:helix-hairpin-helix domain-containing protein [Pyrinomonadaceae bacterium]